MIFENHNNYESTVDKGQEGRMKQTQRFSSGNYNNYFADFHNRKLLDNFVFFNKHST